MIKQQILQYHGLALLLLVRQGEEAFNEGFYAIYRGELAIYHRENPLPPGETVWSWIFGAGESWLREYDRIRNELYALLVEEGEQLYEIHFTTDAERCAASEQQAAVGAIRTRMGEFAAAEL